MCGRWPRRCEVRDERYPGTAVVIASASGGGLIVVRVCHAMFGHALTDNGPPPGGPRPPPRGTHGDVLHGGFDDPGHGEPLLGSTGTPTVGSLPHPRGGYVPDSGRSVGGR